MITPVERLRSVSRRTADDPALAIEAAAALESLAEEPAHLVVACRRLLAHHPASGPLWWLSAQVLAAPDAAAACRNAVRVLEADGTAARLAAALPILAPESVVGVVGWPAVVDRALSERADLDVVALQADGEDPAPAWRRVSRNRASTGDSTATLPIAHLLVPAAAIGPTRALVPAGTGEILAAAPRTVPVWLVGGAGRVLPRRLYEAVEHAVAAPGDDPPVVPLPLECIDRIAGPRGVEAPDAAAARADCPVPAELLRPL